MSLSMFFDISYKEKDLDSLILYCPYIMIVLTKKNIYKLDMSNVPVNT